MLVKTVAQCLLHWYHIFFFYVHAKSFTSMLSAAHLFAQPLNSLLHGQLDR